MNKAATFIIFVMLWCILSQNLFSQEGFTDKKRAEYIFDITKAVTFTNEDSISTYTIGILAADSLLFDELRNYADSVPQIKGKNVDIKLFSNIDSLMPVQVIFLNKKDNFDINRVLNRYRGKNTLVVSENFEFHKSMINFIVINNQRRFEMNENRLKAEGFTISELFKALAVKNKADWQELFAQTEYQLEEEKEKSAKQKKEIALQKSQIEKQKQEIKLQKDSIAIQQAEIEKQKATLSELLQKVIATQKSLKNKNEVLNKQSIEIEKQKADINKQLATLNKLGNDIEEKKKRIEKQEKVLNDQLKKIKIQQLFIVVFVVFILLLVALAYFVFKAYRIKKQANILLENKNREITEQNVEIQKQRDKLAVQNVEILRQKEEIMDSIHYASRIQKAILPPESVIKNILPEHFILNKPRDIVSGDYYWMTKKEKKTIIVAADCTGHGVPGAFMSMLGIAFLNEIVNKNDIVCASEILNQLRQNVMRSLHQTGQDMEAKDGMDLALCIIDQEYSDLEYAGAYNPLYHIRQNKLSVIKADRMPVSIHMKANKPFTKHSVKLEKGDCIYMFSDGYADQFGGEHNRKFMSKRFKKLLINIHIKPMQEQHSILNKTIEDWQGNHPQVDDILVLGLRIS